MTKPAQRRTQQERREETRRKLIDAAMYLFGTRGYSGTTLIEIGKQAGLSPGLVTYHFGTKKDCFRAVLEDIWKANVRANEAQAERGLASLDRRCTFYLRGPSDDRPGARAIFVAIAESISATPELRDLTRKNDAMFRRGVAEALAEAKEDGDISKQLNVEDQAVLVVGLLRGIVLQRLINNRAVNLDRIVPAALSMIHASVGATR